MLRKLLVLVLCPAGGKTQQYTPFNKENKKSVIIIQVWECNTMCIYLIIFMCEEKKHW